jgi:hypothetical protein
MDATLTRALPLWVGTLGDIDDLLPPHPGLFDLVIVDEASSIEQPLAVPALLRGKRAVVAGDPKQLRHVSFVADERHREVMAAHHIDRVPVLAARLDVRRNSLFDVAAGTASVTVLDEHFRSDPHLVDFVARRLYDGRLTVATRSPVTECRDCIEVRRLGGERDPDGVVAAEVTAVVKQLRALRSEGAHSVGVVTPFRAQADALETAVLAAFTADDEQAIPAELLARAQGIAVIPHLIRGGFILGGRRGRGVLSVRTANGQWSNPALITLTGGSIGWQFGAESADVVLVFGNDRSNRHISHGKFTLGGDATAVAGPLGRR